MIRSFLALPVPEDTAARLAMVQTTLPLPREVPPESMHLTLCFLDRQPDAVLEELHQTLEALRIPGFEVRVEGLGFMGSDKQQLVCAMVAPDPALEALQRKVETAARRAGA
jgi:2'-5' RNA ligase